MEILVIRQGARRFNWFLQRNLKLPFSRFATSASTIEKTESNGLCIGVPKEIFPDEKRVSLTPNVNQTFSFHFLRYILTTELLIFKGCKNSYE